MSLHVLIDTLVRQSMVMVARLATSGGLRAPVAHIAEQVFRELTVELRSQGVGHKVIADMFGMSLRAYHAKIRRLDESADARRRSLWQAVLSYLETKQQVTKGELLQRFRHDDPLSVVGVANDLVTNGWVYRRGEGDALVYKLAEEAELSSNAVGDEALVSLVWILVRRHGPLEKRAFASLTPTLDVEKLDTALSALEADGRIRKYVDHGQEHYASDQCLILPTSKDAWMAAVIDHFGAVINTLCARAERQHRSGPYDHLCGGSTFHFELDIENPEWKEVIELFVEVRKRCSELRARVDAHNAQYPPQRPVQVVLYAGQHVVADHETTVTKNSGEI